ncbi:MAG TPA: hypothetical protein VMS87_07145 [Roseiarcus sp.]|nr:hypothetical protein [Roseiarcus sp.]
MTDESNPPQTRSAARKAAKARREHKAGVRQIYFQALASGFTLEEIAELAGVSARTVRREIDRAIAARRLDAPEAYVHLQVARLTKALRLTDAAIDRGLIQAVVPHVKIVAALDRYHGLGPRSASPRRATLAAPPPPEAAAPLRLTRAALPLEEALAQETA